MTRGVSIVIPSWNGLDLLKRFLPSVLDATNRYTNQLGAPTEIVIVDDGSKDDSVAWLVDQGFAAEKGKRALTLAHETQTPGLIVIRNETNRGFGETCNRGFEAASYPLVILLNNDVEVDPNFIRPLADNFADATVFAAHCRVFELDSEQECGTGKLGSFARGFIRVHKSYIFRAADIGDKRQRGVKTSARPAPLYSMFAGGGSAMFDREKFIEIGGFEPLLSPFYWEDVELSYRAWKRGYIVVYEPRSVTRHRVSSTISKLDPRRVRRLQQRNRLIYHWIHLHQSSLILSHVLWVLLLAVTAPIRLKPWFISSCIDALRRLPEIRKRRIEERRAAQRSDRDVFSIFKELERRADVIAYDQYSELASSRNFIER